MKRFEIVTERMVLAPLGPEYLESTNEYALEVENTKFMMFLPYRDSDETLEFLKNAAAQWEKEAPDFYEFAMLLEGNHIGTVSLYRENELWELGWVVNRRYWGKGYAYEAAAALIEYFSEHFGVKHFIAHCDAENLPSYRLMEKLGMVRTKDTGMRKNRSADHESREYRYDLYL